MDQTYYIRTEPAMKVNLLTIHGIEADDIVASCAKVLAYLLK